MECAKWLERKRPGGPGALGSALSHLAYAPRG